MALTKKSKIIIAVTAAALVVIGAVVALVLLLLPSSDDERLPTFGKAEYTVSDGDRISAGNGAKYVLLGNVPDGVSISTGGVFSVSQNVADGTQVLVGATKNGKVVATAVCTLSVECSAPVVAFDNLSEFIVDGENISASTTPMYSIVYELKNPVDGISINSVTGVVKFGAHVADGTPFTVVARAKGGSNEKTFSASVGAHVSAVSDRVFVEYGVGGKLETALDFGGDGATEAQGVKGVSLGGRLLNESEWRYDAQRKSVSVANSVLKTLIMGESELRIYTSRNAVYVSVTAAKFVRNAEDLAAIKANGDDKSALSQHYVLVNDIDLTDYLASGDGNGWTPIGIYRDVADGTAEHDAFSGTFDGNGHTISGLWMNRNDDYAYNGGLFGFVTISSVISNLNVKGSSTPHTTKSFSGTLVGVNNGIIRNCSADVDLVHEGVDKCGAFVGRNFGTIENCYSLGSITPGSGIGAFCGENTGEIKNCYAVSAGLAFCGTDLGETVDCATYTSAADMAKSADFSAFDGWTVENGKLPTLPSVRIDVISTVPTSVTIKNAESEYAVGDTITLEVEITPFEAAEYVELDFTVLRGDGIAVSNDGVINTSGAAAGIYTVRVICGELHADFTFTLTD